MSGRASKRKGNRVERELVLLHLEHDVHAERVPLSGGAGGSFAGDVIVARRFRCEVKARKNGAGFATLERWLGQHDALFLRRNRAEPLVVVPARTWFALLAAASTATDGAPMLGGRAP